jgi:hypothetical protein
MFLDHVTWRLSFHICRHWTGLTKRDGLQAEYFVKHSICLNRGKAGGCFITKGTAKAEPLAETQLHRFWGMLNLHLPQTDQFIWPRIDCTVANDTHPCISNRILALQMVRQGRLGCVGWEQVHRAGTNTEAFCAMGSWSHLLHSWIDNSICKHSCSESLRCVYDDITELWSTSARCEHNANVPIPITVCVFMHTWTATTKVVLCTS